MKNVDILDLFAIFNTTVEILKSYHYPKVYILTFNGDTNASQVSYSVRRLSTSIICNHYRHMSI